MKKRKIGKKLLAILLSLTLISASALSTVYADAGPPPPEVGEDEMTFPDPDSFSYDDVEVNFAKALQLSLYFYDANKCGAGVTGGNLEWRGDCHVEDYNIPLVPMSKEGADTLTGTNLSQDFIDEHKDILDPDGDGFIDCGGGMHDAGDHVKFGLPGSYAASTLGWGYYEFRDAYVKSGNQEHTEDILRWFNDFYLKSTYLDENGKVIAFCYQVAEGNNDHNYWNAPELQDRDHLRDFGRPAYFATKEKPASDMCAGTAASLAINYLNFKDTYPEYAAESLKKALALYEFAVETHSADGKSSLGYDGGFYTSSYDWDELSWAAVWLYECTGNKDYIEQIISIDEDSYDELSAINGTYKYDGYLQRIISDTGNCWQNIWVHCWDTVWGGVFAKLAPITNLSRDWYIFRWNLEYWSGLEHLDPGQDDLLWNKEYDPNDQAIDKGDSTALAKTPAGFSMLNNYGSARYNTAAQLCALVYAKYSPEENNMRFAEWAKGQMEYIMGKNPMDRCYIVGYADNSAVRPHHRAAHGSKTLNMDVPWNQSHVLWGALVGGPDQTDWHRDITKDYIYNEVAVDYNAGFVGAAAGLYYYFGDETMKPEPNFPPKEPEATEFWLKALINQENKERTQLTIQICNDTSQPPRYIDNLKARYYFNLSEVFEKNQTLEDIKIEIYYDQEFALTNGETFAKVSDPIKVDEKGNYYVEIDWTGCSFFGTREIQFGIIVGQDENYGSNWNPTNDYSREGLVMSDTYGETDKIPLYLGDELVFGTPLGGVVETKLLYGDMNLDNKVDNLDLVLLCRHLIKEASLTGKGLEAADIVADGSIDVADLATLKQYIMGDKVTLGPKK